MFGQTNILEPELHYENKFQGNTGAYDFVIQSNKVYTVCESYNKTNELWVFDENKNSMERLFESISFETSINILGTEFDEIIIFSVHEEFKGTLWRTDGTKSGTYMIMDLSVRILESIMFNGYLYFTAADEPGGDYGLWRTDGTTLGTSLVKYVKEKRRGEAFDFHILNQKLIYTFATGYTDTEAELWVTDGTEEETKRLASMVMSGRLMTEVIGDKLVFAHTPYPPFDSELWVTDGTVEGTSRLDNKLGIVSIDINQFDIFNNKLYISMSKDITSNKPWVSDGTIAGTSLLVSKNQIECSNPIFFPFHSNQKDKLMYLAVEEGPYYSIMLTDGTIDGTYAITSGNDLFKVDDYNFSLSEDKFYFLNSNYKIGNELWVSDFTKEGTHLVKDIEEGEKSSIIRFTGVNFKGKTIFSNRDENEMNSIWVTDGTEVNTFILNDELTNLPEKIGNGKIINDFVFFTENTTSNLKSRLWRTDMTKEGTSLIQTHDATNMEQIIGRNTTVAFKNHIYFFADYYGEGQQLYRIPNTISSVEDTPQPELMTVYPNPAKDFIQLELSKPMQLSIVNSAGAMVKDYGEVADGKLNVAELLSGVYFVVDEQGNNIAKFVKE